MAGSGSAAEPPTGPIQLPAPAAADLVSGRWSLRSRLIALVLLVATLALVGVGVVLPIVVRSALTQSRDASLAAVISALPASVDTAYLTRLAASSTLKGGIGWTIVSADGSTQVVVAAAGDGDGPTLTEPHLVPATVAGPQGSYRVLSRLVSDSDHQVAYLVAWTAADDIDDAVERLILAEVLIGAGLLVMLGSAASLLIRRELRPLEQMATVADEIAAGDLTQRVKDERAGVEVDRLSRAINGMLDGIDSLLAQRQRDEERLRQFVADASHELRTPVAAVRGYSDLYAAGALPESEQVGRAMERMGAEARRMGSLVEDLLTLTQAEARDQQLIDRVPLVPLLHEVVQDAQAIDPSREWSVAIGVPDQPTAIGDRHRLHQLVANLLGNVRIHTPPGTSTTVSLEPGPAPNLLVLAVSDTGPGVDARLLPVLFDRFTRADPSRSRAHGGSGLGLAIVAAIARAHDGTVRAVPMAPHGLRIEVTLPRG